MLFVNGNEVGYLDLSHSIVLTDLVELNIQLRGNYLLCGGLNDNGMILGIILLTLVLTSSLSQRFGSCFRFCWTNCPM